MIALLRTGTERFRPLWAPLKEDTLLPQMVCMVAAASK